MIAAADPKARLGSRLRAAGHLRRQRGRRRHRGKTLGEAERSQHRARTCARARAREPGPGARRDPRAVHGARHGARARLRQADDVVAGADHADAGRGRHHHRDDRQARPARRWSASTSAAPPPTCSRCSRASFNRTVSANLGMSYSVSNVMAEAGIENILRWVPFAVDERRSAQPDQEQDDPPDHDSADARRAGDRAGDRAEALRLAFVAAQAVRDGAEGRAAAAHRLRHVRSRPAARPSST